MAYVYKIETAIDKYIVGGPYSSSVKARKALLDNYISKYRKKYPNAELLIEGSNYDGRVDYAVAIKKWVFINESSGAVNFLNRDGTLGKKFSQRDWKIILG